MAINRLRFRTTYTGSGSGPTLNNLIAVVTSPDGPVTDGVDFGWDTSWGGYNNELLMWIPAGGTTYSIQAVPLPEHKELFPMRINSLDGGTFTMEIYEYDFAEPFICNWIIYDKELDKYWDWNNQGPYTFTVPAATYTNDRIYLLARVMPVHKKMRHNWEGGGLIFSGATPEQIADYDNAVPTIEYLKKNQTTKPVINSTASATYTLAADDAFNCKKFTAANVTVTIDTGSLVNEGDWADLDFWGTGVMTIAAGTATLRVNPNRYLLSDGQYSRIRVQKMSATEYRVFGELDIQ